jgi:hypothetical protein
MVVTMMARPWGLGRASDPSGPKSFKRGLLPTQKSGFAAVGTSESLL